MGEGKIKICFAAPHAYPVLREDLGHGAIGGAEIQQVLIARELVSRGYDISFVCQDYGQDPDETIDGIRILRSHKKSVGLPGIRIVWPKLIKTVKALRAADADIYYQRTAGRLTGIVAAFCRWQGKKSVFAAAGNPDLFGNTPRIQSRHDRYVYEYGLRHVDRLIVQNPEQQRLAKTNYSREAELIKNCYPVPRCDRDLPGDDVIWVSTIRRIKRVEIFIDLARSLVDRKFAIIGGADRNVSEPFETAVRAARGIINLEFRGHVPYSQVDTHFDNASVLVNTSESEGFPNTFLQAWSRGVPTVSFIDCGARSLGEPVGLIVNTPAELRDVVSRLTSDQAFHHEHGERCRRYYLDNHSPGAVMSAYQRLFSEMLSQG